MNEGHIYKLSSPSAFGGFHLSAFLSCSVSVHQNDMVLIEIFCPQTERLIRIYSCKKRIRLDKDLNLVKCDAEIKRDSFKLENRKTGIF